MIKGFTCGAFDLLHPGHIAMLGECRSQCDFLYVGLHTDPTIDRPKKNKPIQSTLERYIQLKHLRLINEIIPYDTEKDLTNLMAVLDIQKRFVGADHIDDYITGQEIMDKRKIEVVFTSRSHDWSSSELRERLK